MNHFPKKNTGISELGPGLLALAILAASGYTRGLLNGIRAWGGPIGLKLLIGAVFVAGAGGFIWYVWRQRLETRRLVVLFLIATAGLAYSFLVPAWPEERLHLLEYATLGWFGFNLVRKNATSRLERMGVPLLFGILVGGCDELLQFYLPDRVGDIRDVVFNSLGTAWGVALRGVILGERQ